MNDNAPRILDRSTYPRKTLETYETIAAFYVDMFYNHLYFEAKKLRNDKAVNSITEGYKHTLMAFLQGIEDPKLYKKSLLGMHTFFINIGFTSVTFSQCIDRVIKEFIPNDYYDSVSNDKKNIILRNVLSNVNKTFVLKLVNKYLSMVIDQHNEPDNPRILQDEFIDLLLLEREGMYRRFIAGKTKAGHRSAQSSAAIIESMQREIKVLCSEKYNLKKLIINLKKIIITKERQIHEYKDETEKLTNIVNELKNELQENNLKPVVSVETAMSNEPGDSFAGDSSPDDPTDENAEADENTSFIVKAEDPIVDESPADELAADEYTAKLIEEDEEFGDKNYESKNIMSLLDETNDIEKRRIGENHELFMLDENTDIWDS